MMKCNPPKTEGMCFFFDCLVSMLLVGELTGISYQLFLLNNLSFNSKLIGRVSRNGSRGGGGQFSNFFQGLQKSQFSYREAIHNVMSTT